MPVALFRPRRPRTSALWQCLSQHREAFERHHTFHALPLTDWDRVAELLQARVLKFFVRKDKLSAREAQKMRQWYHSGFNIHAGYRIQRDDHDGLENLAQYILRNPFFLEKMTYIPESGEVHLPQQAQPCHQPPVGAVRLSRLHRGHHAPHSPARTTPCPLLWSLQQPLPGRTP